MASTVAALTRAEVSRVGLVSAAVLFPGRGISFAFFRWMLQHIARDLRAAEEILSATSLDWTVVRPPRLNDAASDHYRASVGTLPPGASVVSFRSVAAFLLDSLEERRHIREIVGLGR